MLCPEGSQLLNDILSKDEKETYDNKCKKVPVEGSGNLELSSYKNPRTWKKSISNFFRNQLRSTRSNDVRDKYVFSPTFTANILLVSL